MNIVACVNEAMEAIKKNYRNNQEGHGFVYWLKLENLNRQYVVFE
jgi:hypothetical protein